MIRLRLEPALGKVRLDKVTAEEVDAFLNNNKAISYRSG
jgi:hypothetical protein